MSRWKRAAWRALALLVMCALALQVAFALQIGALIFTNPASTSFQRSEAWRLLGQSRRAANGVSSGCPTSASART